MKLLLSAFMLASLLNASTGEDPTLESLKNELDSLVDSFNGLKKAFTDLSRQTMLQQFSVEERTRIDSDSGIKSIRSRKRGLKNYESPSHVGGAVNAIHDHANYRRTLGMGEVSVVMNGINFRTRHNDYKLVMPSTTSREFRKTDKIEFPDVPPEVKGTLEEQVKEMRQWFKAFKTQNVTLRNYTNYFKPVLCYIEGTWTLDKDLQEPFSSDRHRIDASSWFDLQEKLMFTSYTGSKSSQENIAYLPTSILSVNGETGIPNFAQFNYRILCKPIRRDIPLSMLKYVDDLAFRMRDGKTVEQTLDSRAARFKLFDDQQSDNYQVLDEIFYEIPGMDNIPDDNLTQATLGEGTMLDVAHTETRVPLKNGFYHRQFKFSKKGAMGLNVSPRGFNDENLWVAQTSQNRVAPVSLTVCERKRGKGKNCQDVFNRFSYALPLELVYLTPLLTWNPHNFTIHEKGGQATANGADGRKKPYNGVDFSHYFLTPYELFSQNTGQSRDPADTARGTVSVKDQNNETQRVRASGTRIILGNIPDVGRVRLRYPIAPVSDEGSSVWKELTALKDLVQAMQDKMEESTSDSGPQVDEIEPEEVSFQMATTVKDPPGEHYHEITMPYKVFKSKLKRGRVVKITTDQHQGHTHALKMKYDKGTQTFRYIRCDARKLCWDEHPTDIRLITNSSYTLL